MSLTHDAAGSFIKTKDADEAVLDCTFGEAICLRILERVECESAPGQENNAGRIAH